MTNRDKSRGGDPKRLGAVLPGYAVQQEPTARLQLDRPLVFFDVETTGVHAEKDRIITLSLLRVEPGQAIAEQVKGRMKEFKFDPGFPVPPKITELTGIRPLDVFGCPYFDKQIPDICPYFSEADLCAYNGKFDIDFMVSEFGRAGEQFKMLLPLDWRLVDPKAIFTMHFNGKHTLTDAVGYYLHRAIEDAHTSGGDVRSMIDVLFAQLSKHNLRGTAKEISELTVGRFFDPDYRILRDDKGKARLAFGKHQGRLVWELLDHPAKGDEGYIDWCMKNFFEPETRAVINQFKGYLEQRKK